MIQGYLDYYRDGKTVDELDSLEFKNIAGEQTTTPGTTTPGTEASEQLGTPINYTGFLFFPNDIPFPQDDIYSNVDYGNIYSGYTKQ